MQKKGANISLKGYDDMELIRNQSFGDSLRA